MHIRIPLDIQGDSARRVQLDGPILLFEMRMESLKEQLV